LLSDISAEPFVYGNVALASNKQDAEQPDLSKFDLIKNGIVVNDTKVTLEEIIGNSTTKWEETEWEFPKGRRNFQEKDIECALREFQEETGYPIKSLSVIENLLPFEETFIGSNHKCYKHKYYLAYMNDIGERETSLENYQRSEVSKLEWKTVDECLESIRPYNLEKKQLIMNINKVLQEYRLYS
jgi:8-oxo-dGTP pyrophosphatase MutT (NUDIX family)